MTFQTVQVDFHLCQKFFCLCFSHLPTTLSRSVGLGREGKKIPIAEDSFHYGINSFTQAIVNGMNVFIKIESVDITYFPGRLFVYYLFCSTFSVVKVKDKERERERL